jgi:hypothetical protein
MNGVAAIAALLILKPMRTRQLAADSSGQPSQVRQAA